jgi:hypothetical protein
MNLFKRTVPSAVVSGVCIALFLACSDEKEQGNDQKNALDSGHGDGAKNQKDSQIDQNILDSGGSDGVISDKSPGLQGACESSNRIGFFELDIDQSKSFVNGQVQNGVLPTAIQTKVADLGPCKLSRQPNPICNPLCMSGTSCNTDSQCIPSPTDQNVGTVSVTGLVKEVNLKFGAYFDTTLPGLVAEPGAPVQLTATGNELSGFTLSGKGVTPLVITDSLWSLNEGQPTTIRWAPASVADATIMVRIGLDQHGSNPAQLVCEVEDNGSLTISADQIAQLIALGVSVPEKGMIERHTVDSVQIDKGCIEFTVRSRILVEARFTRAAH